MMKNTPTLRKLTKNPNVRCLLEKNINDISDLQKRLQDCTFVAFDTEGAGRGFNKLTPHGEDASELGVAILRPNGKIPNFATNCVDFYNQNNIEAFTLRLSPRNGIPAVGTWKSVRPNEAGSELYNVLNHIKGPRILLGWDLRLEFLWIASAYPKLSNLFTAWCDVQDLVMHLRKSICPGHGKAVSQPALIRTAKSMEIHDSSPYMSHIAANDCVKSLAILSGLFHDVASDSNKCRSPNSVQKLLYLPSNNQMIISQEVHRFTSRITTDDGTRLPPRTPDGLHKLFAKHKGLKGVACNMQTKTTKENSVRYWWVSFRSKDQLDRFFHEVDGLELEGKTLRVIVNDVAVDPRVERRLKGLLVDV